MKKLQLDPLALDKNTIAMLDTTQLQDVIGGTGTAPSSSSGGGSTGCGSGSSQCRTVVNPGAIIGGGK